MLFRSILKKNNLFHGNLKPENILVDQENKIRVIITDFLLTEKETWKNEKYAAPEIISGENFPNLMSDIWSIGSILKFIVENTISPSKTCLDLMHKCLRSKVKQRINFGEILVHPYFALLEAKKKFCGDNLYICT